MAALQAALGAQSARFDVDVLDRCDSTNAEMQRRLQAGKAVPGLVLLTFDQTAGRGRRGRAWLLPAGGGLAFTLLWQGGGEARRYSALPLVVGLAVRRALLSCGVADVGLKWPNDLLVPRTTGFAKLGGVLVESQMEAGRTLAVIGLGLNLRQGNWLEDVGQPAVALDQLAPGLSVQTLLPALLNALLTALESLERDGFAAVRGAWCEAHVHEGQPVVVSGGPEPISGTCCGVDGDGALLLASPGGRLHTVHAGDVSLKTA